MDDTTSDTLDQTDEDVLTYTASDDALEAAATQLAQQFTQWSLCVGIIYRP